MLQKNNFYCLFEWRLRIIVKKGLVPTIFLVRIFVKKLREIRACEKEKKF